MLLLSLFVLGTIFWSFGSVLLWRLDSVLSRKIFKGILLGSSQCPSCHCRLIRWKLIPLLWWLIQWWKCQSCRQPISTLYPVCEIMSGLVFVWWGLRVTDYAWWIANTSWWSNLLLLTIWWLLWLILVWDIYTYQLHLKMWYILCVVLCSWIWSIGDPSLLRGAMIGWSVFIMLYLFARIYVKRRFHDSTHYEWIGMGDVMIAPIIGTLLASHLWSSGTSLLWRSLSIDMSGIGMVQLTIIFILGTCLLGLLWYTVSRLFFSSSCHSPDWSEGMGPVIPFLPSMIMMYWIIVYLSM